MHNTCGKVPAKKAKTSKPSSGSGNGVRRSPVNSGELNQKKAKTFTGSSYTERVLTEDTTMYRVYGGEAGKIGKYFSITPQNGGLQSQMDLALNPSWGNTAEHVARAVIPKGTQIYEGTAAPQVIRDSMGNGIGILPGGGNQVYIPNIRVEWFK